MKNILTLLFAVILNSTFLILHSFATSYTWNGTTSTAWATTTNWTPNGTPGSGDDVTIVTTGNQPALSGNVTVTAFTMTSGTLNLGSYTLNVSGTLAANGGTINNGTLNASGSATATFAGTVFNCTVTVVCNDVYLNGSEFNAPASFTKNSSGDNYSNGGNTFNDAFTIIHNGSGILGLGVSQADEFNALATFTANDGYLAPAAASSGNVFADDVYLFCSGTDGILMNYAGTAAYSGNIYLACDDAGGTISFGQSGGSATLASGKTLLKDAAGFEVGQLVFSNFTKYGTTAINLAFGDYTALTLGTGNVFNGSFTFSGGHYYLNGTTFNHAVSFSQNYDMDSYSSGGNTFNGNAEFINNSANDSYLANATGDDFNADVTFTQNSTGLFFPGYNGTTTYAGNITANGGDLCEYGYGAGLSRNVLDGSTVQYIGGTAPEHRFLKLTVNKPAGYVDLESPVGILDSLVLTQGIVKTTTTDYLMVRNDAKAIGASNSSHIEGVVVKGGDDVFTYPVGRNGHYRAITMSAPANTSDVFYAEYFNKNSNDSYSHSSKDGSIAALSTAEYWNLVRYAGTSNVSVTLSWDTIAASCSFASAANLKVASWDGSQWKDRGNGGTTGNLVAGTVVTSSASTTYGAYTLGTSASFYCVPCYADAGEDKVILIGDEIQIGQTAESATDYEWTPANGLDDDEISDPIAQPYEYTLYKLTSTNLKGCEATDFIIIDVLNRFCYTEDEENSGSEKFSVNTYCDDWLTYIPNPEDNPNLHNLLSVRLSIVIVQNSSEESEYSDDYATDLAYFQYLINQVNVRLRNLCEPTWENISPTVEIFDTKIEFVIDDLYYEQSTDLSYIENVTELNEVYNYFAHKETETINVFIVRDNGPTSNNNCPGGGYQGCGVYGSGYEFQYEPTLKYPNLYMFNSGGAIDENLFIHELGHTLGLNHPFSGENIPDTPDEPNVCPLANLCSNNYMGYNNQLDRCYFSPMQIGKMRMNIENNLKRYSSVLNLGTLYTNSLLQCQKQSETALEINENQTWAKAVVIDRDIIVKSGNILTVQCKVSMPEDSKIIVEEGAILVVDGGYITNSCFSVWDGVQVWGIPTQPQGFVDFENPDVEDSDQGVIILKNGAVIENAKWGVMLADGEGSVTKTGGIIVAENSTFRNNRKDVAFMQYKPYSISDFVNCTFLTDQPMNGTDYNGEGSNGHVTIWGVRGIDFYDCDFVCDIDDSWDSDEVFYNFDKHKRGLGIASVDALYSINSTDSDDDNERSRFINLTRGVWAGKAYNSQVKWTHIDGALFDNCTLGTELDGSTQDRITDCDYYIPAPAPQLYDSRAWGIYTVGCKNFRIENNTFNDISTSSAYNIGIINQGYKLNGISGGLVKGNIHNGTYVGNQMERNNPYLKISCNEYENHAASWAICPEVPNQILGPQGSGCNPDFNTRADNLFIDQSDDIWSYAQFWSYWAADAASAVPDFATPATNGTVGTSGLPCDEIFAIDCEPSSGGFGDEKARKAALDEKYADLVTEYEAVESSLDNGQYAAMLTNIANSGYSNATLTSELVANSPLSDEVLEAALERTSFSSQQKIDFTVPNCPVSGKVWQVIDESFAGPIPNDIVEAQAESTVRTLTAIEREGETVLSDLFMTINSIFRLYVEADSIDGLIYYMKDTLDHKEAHKLLVGTLLEVDSIELARTVLEGIGLADAEEEAFYDFYDIAVTLAENQDTWFEIDGSQRTTIETLAESDYEIAINAQAILWLLDGEVFQRVPELMPDSASKWDGEQQQPTQQQTLEETIALKKISVYPNPFNNSFNVNYILEQEADEVRIEVFDLMGRNMFTKQIGKTGRGNVNVDLGECLGVYVLRIYADDRQVHKEKLICLQR